MYYLFFDPDQKQQSRLPRVISPRVHGIVDYAQFAFFLGMGLMLRKSNPRAAAASFTAAGFGLVQTVLTDYPLGVWKVIPFHTHGIVDGSFATASMAMPKVFGFSGTAAERAFQANAGVEAVVGALTDWKG